MAKHGGAWKVAYADFITAMMALFMVLWILGSEEDLLEQLQEYFRNPPSPFDSKSGKYPVDMGEFSGHTSEDAKEVYFERADPAALKGIVEEFYKLLNMETRQDLVPPIEMSVTSDGLRLVIFDREDTPLFSDGEAKLSSWGVFLTQNLAWLLSRYPFRVVIESHSGEMDAMHQSNWTREYGPWELSADRANEIRRSLQFYTNGDLHMQRVSGYGATRPLEGGTGRGRTNQRISLSLSLAGSKDRGEKKTDTVEIAEVLSPDDN